MERYFEQDLIKIVDLLKLDVHPVQIVLYATSEKKYVLDLFIYSL